MSQHWKEKEPKIKIKIFQNVNVYKTVKKCVDQYTGIACESGPEPVKKFVCFYTENFV